MKLPRGFRFAGVAAGIRPSKPDVALFVSERDAACAGVFTVNRAKAAPVVDAERRLPAENMRAIVVTSGNANALTGPAGLEAVDAVLIAAAGALGVDRCQVVSAATGVIGMRMPFEKVVAALPRCVDQLGPDPAPAAEAIMTTDTTKKLASRTLVMGGQEVTLAGTRCVIEYGSAAMARDGLKRSFCDDVLLLHSVGLAPIVVHDGGSDLAHARGELGGQAEVVEGIRVTPASELRVVAMLTGSINTELVTILNRGSAHAVGLSGKDAALLRAKKLVRDDGRDLGQVGELVEVNQGFLESLIGQRYIPVISPVGLGADGQSYDLSADAVAAGIARALGADKLMYLADVLGIVEHGELVSELTPSVLRGKLEAGGITGGMAVKMTAALAALAGGVRAVHVIDGRIPHNLIAELFTDTGVGTLVRGDA